MDGKDMSIAPLQPEDTPIGLAVRVGQLERTTADGLKSLGDKLDTMANNFATQPQLLEAKQEAEKVHVGLASRIKALEAWNEWAVKIVLTVVILSILALAGLKVGGAL